MPKRYYRGQPLDTSRQDFGQLRSSGDVLEDFAELRRRIDEGGYILLPELLGLDEVLAVRREVLGRISTLGMLDDHLRDYHIFTQPSWHVGTTLNE
jgi:hypothetical protein